MEGWRCVLCGGSHTETGVSLMGGELMDSILIKTKQEDYHKPVRI